MEDDKLKLLVVEDDEDDYLLVRDLLKTGVNAEVERAASADQALERTQTGAYDAMLLDYRLGAQNGLDLLSAMRRRDVASPPGSPARAAVALAGVAPVIFLTGHGDEQVAVEAMKAGAIDYLAKSKLTQPALARAVHYAVILRQKEAAVAAARRALLASEQRCRALVENSSDVISLLGADGAVLYVSHSVQRILGYKPEELIETDSMALVHPADQPRLRNLLEQVLRSPGVPLGDEHRARHHDGHYLVMECTVTNRLDDDAVRAVVLNSRDVSQRRQAEEALRQSEAEYRTLFENANDAIMIFEPENETILEVNPKTCELYGYARAELLGKSLAELSGDVERGKAAIVRCVAEGSLKDYETVHQGRDGKPICIIANASVIDYRGRKALLTVSRDVTEHRNLQQQLLHSQKLEAVGQLAGGVAHDFNNLLMVIGGHAELLRDSTGDPSVRRKAYEIVDAVQRGCMLTQQLLAFSRKQVLSPRVLDLNHTLAEMGAMLSRMLGEKIQVRVQPGRELWAIKADPAQIEQVVMNLAVNARDAMPDGGELTLETSNVELGDDYARTHAGVMPGRYVMLAVSDTGEGIPPEAQPHLFEPFFTTKEHGKGTGLGLSTVYGIAKQSGGFVWVYSEVGHGSVFKVYLPRVEAPRLVEPAPAPASASPRGTGTVLLVEDEEPVRDAVREYLSLRGYEVLEAGDGEQALALASRFPRPIHLLISDVVMPGINGREMAQRFLLDRPDTRVLFISGYTESTVANHNLHAGASFLQKPFSLSVLAAKVREVLEPKAEAVRGKRAASGSG